MGWERGCTEGAEGRIHYIWGWSEDQIETNAENLRSCISYFSPHQNSAFQVSTSHIFHLKFVMKVLFFHIFLHFDNCQQKFNFKHSCSYFFSLNKTVDGQ